MEKIRQYFEHSSDKNKMQHAAAISISLSIAISNVSENKYFKAVYSVHCYEEL
jgi:hypothetical protein